MKNSMYFGLLTAIVATPHITLRFSVVLGIAYLFLTLAYLVMELRSASIK